MRVASDHSCNDAACRTAWPRAARGASVPPRRVFPRIARDTTG